MEKIKVIFLDIDGVLNNSNTTRTTQNGCIFVSARLIKRLRHIIQETGAKVVLSSDWRIDRNEELLNADFLELKYELAKYGIRFYDYTPVMPTGHRGSEINRWLKEHNEVENFVILDDRCDIEPNKDHWVQTAMSCGLGKEETKSAIKLLITQSFFAHSI